MKRGIQNAVAVAGVMAFAWVLFEGAFALWNGGSPSPSIAYRTLSLFSADKDPTAHGETAYAPFFTRPEELSGLLDEMKQQGVGVGNTPFMTTITNEASMNAVIDGCPALKPNLDKTAVYLRTNAFNPLDPPTVFYDTGRALDGRLSAFLDRYGTHRVRMTSNADGERTTLPAVRSDRKALVVGDSVAYGAMVNDDETIAAELQKRDGGRTYVNLGVAGVDADAVICRMEKAARRYEGAIDEIVYVYCENDFKPRRPFGHPKEVIDWLKAFAARERVTKVTIVFSPYIYMVAPELTRFPGAFGASYPYRVKEWRELAGEAKAAGFGWVDIGVIAKAEEERAKTRYGALDLFVDHNHLSPEGAARVAQAILAN